MQTHALIRIVAPIVLLLAAGWVTPAHASTVLTLGSGSAVTTVDLSTTFDNLDFAHNGTPLDSYQSHGLSVVTNGNSYYGDNALGQVGLGGEPVNPNSPYLNPFHITGPSGPSYWFIGGGYYFPYDGEFGNQDWVTIQTVTQHTMYGVEFLYGNGWSNGDIYGQLPWGNSTIPLEWETYNGAALVSSGSIITGIGTVVGFLDPVGFDRLRVRAPGNGTNWQEIALDNLVVQTTVPLPVCPGDLNCDGAVDFADIDPFVLALSGEPAYLAQFPNCRWLNGDANGDQTVDFADIDAFVGLLFTACP